MFVVYDMSLARAEHAMKEMKEVSNNRDGLVREARDVPRPLSGIGNEPVEASETDKETLLSTITMPLSNRDSEVDGRNHMRKENENNARASKAIGQKNLRWYITHQDESELTSAYRELYGKYIELVRRKRRLTREQLSQKAQISIDLLTALERGIAGEDQVEEEALKRLVRTLGITFDQFIALNPQVITELWSSPSATPETSMLATTVSSNGR